MTRMLWLATVALTLTTAPPTSAEALLAPCRLQGVEHGALCGKLARPLDPGRPDGASIDVHFAVLPALARNKKPDPVVFFAGGPGQSALALAGPVSRLVSRLSNRRDILLIDQRGTGRSAPLRCEAQAPTQPLRDALDPLRQREQWRECLDRLQRLPHGDLRQYTTSIAMADVEAVRQALGAAQVNLIGGSYGTRAALEYLRLYPQAVRRIILDGVAPPDMVLPMSFSVDAQAAFDALVSACEADPLCARHYPDLAGAWRRILARLPQEVTVLHPVTGASESFTLTRETAKQIMRVPLYSPALASALPMALSEAAEGRFAALFGVANAFTGRPGGPMDLAAGMHYAVICAEDLPRLPAAAQGARGSDASAFGDSFAEHYRGACAGWQAGRVDEAFYRVPSSPAATWVLSGGIDPVTPPRHGEQVAKALGAKARHVQVPMAGHGVMGIGCMRDQIYRFIDAASDDEALAVDALCVTGIPRPPAFQPPRPPAQP